MHAVMGLNIISGTVVVLYGDAFRFVSFLSFLQHHFGREQST
jgi:hypothetical protein